ncbi:MAG TPA: ATP-binding protein [Gaiellaceae bacterium]|nr:ATP-binding protein [Gaiellaceae bacterium]
MSRLPIRLRLTLAFALAMALVLAATGAFLYLRLQSSLDEAIDETLEARAADVASGYPYPSVEVGSPDQERGWQVLSGGTGVVHTTPITGPLRPVSPVLRPGEVARAADGPLVIDRREVGGLDAPARLLAVPLEGSEGSVVVVAQSLEDRDETLSGFLVTLLLVGLGALVLVSLIGYAVAAAALRPVERMRAEAASVSADEPGRRLPLPRARDEIRRLGETLNGMLGRLEDALERERSFVADASHELRTPLALLQAELELALRQPRSREELELALASASEETDRLVRLAEDLLVLARSDQGRLGVCREPVPVAGLLGDVAGRFGVRVQVDAAPNGLTVTGDRARLEQALGSLVDNALRHGGGSATLSAESEDSAVELHVRDEGPGFPPEFLPRAFERFSRPDEARSGGGAGLGLAIARAIAEAHGGAAGAANRSARGADVWLSLPA